MQQEGSLAIDISRRLLKHNCRGMRTWWSRDIERRKQSIYSWCAWEQGLEDSSSPALRNWHMSHFFNIQVLHQGTFLHSHYQYKFP